MAVFDFTPALLVKALAEFEHRNFRVSNVRCQRYPWGRIFKGTKEALIAARLAHEDWFATGTDRHGRGNRMKKLCFNGRSVTTMSTKGRSIVELRIELTDHERARERDAAEQAERESVGSLVSRMTKAAAEREVQVGVEQWRSGHLSHLDVLMASLVRGLMGYGSKSLADADLRTICSFGDQIRNAISTAPVLTNRPRAQLRLVR